MTTRHVGYVVTLDRDVREDDAQPILDALRMVKGVAAVTPLEGTAETYIALDRARFDLGQRILRAVQQEVTR